MPSLRDRPKVETDLVPSRLQFRVIVPLYICILLGVVALWPSSWYGWMLGLLVTALLAELWFVWLARSKDSGRLILLRSGTLQWRGVWYAYIPLFSCRYFVILFLRTKGRFQFLPIWKDSCSQMEFHHLHLLIRFILNEKK